MDEEARATVPDGLLQDKVIISTRASHGAGLGSSNILKSRGWKNANV